MEVLVRLSTTREMLAESQASLESSRTVDSDTELLNQPFFDKQVEKLISFARRNLSDVALICIRVELSMPQNESWEGETDQRIKLVGRALAASIRLEDLGTRTDRMEFCVATPSSGLSGVLRFAARLRKVLENIEAAGPGRRGLDLHRAFYAVGGIAPQRRGVAHAGAKARCAGADRIGHAASSWARPTARRRARWIRSPKTGRWTLISRWR